MNGFFAEATQSTINLVATYGALFLAIGLSMFKVFAVVRVVWECFLVAFRSESPNSIPRLVVTIALTYSCLVYYAAPFPGVGKSLTKVITDGGAELAQVIDTTTEETIGDKLAQAAGDTQATGWSVALNWTAGVRYFILIVALSIMQAAIFGVIALGFIVAGIMVLIGPLFVPFLIVPHFEWMAFNWFRCLLQYAFYPVIGNAFVFVFGEIWIHFLSQVTFPLTNEQLAAKFTVIIVMAVSGVYGLLKVPQIVSNLFSGSAGLGMGPGELKG
jgi:hypothetical protein